MQRVTSVAVLLGSMLVGCSALPHVDSAPNVTLLDREHQQEDEFVELQPVIQPSGDTHGSSAASPERESMCQRKIQAEVVATPERNWTQKAIDAALYQCMHETKNPDLTRTD